jgi:hypothetical protein
MNFNFPEAVASQLSAVSLKGELLFPPQTCKDYTKDGISRAVNWEWASKNRLYNPGVAENSRIDLEHPMFVTWTYNKTVERNSIKFRQMINQVEELLGISPSVAYPVSSGASQSAAPFVAEMNSWWIKSPVSTDFCLLFMRLSIAMQLNEGFNEFLKRMFSKLPHKYAIDRDVSYLKSARDNGNLTGFLEKSLPCLNREGYSDHILSNSTRGFSNYSIKFDSAFPLTESELLLCFANLKLPPI